MIKIITSKMSHEELGGFCNAHFKTFVKFVVDIQNDDFALGGELHADAEELLLKNGSKQSNLWGGNFFPWKIPAERLEFTSFINIRPRDNNPDMEVMDEAIRNHMRELCEQFLLSPEEVMSIGEPEE